MYAREGTSSIGDRCTFFVVRQKRWIKSTDQELGVGVADGVGDGVVEGVGVAGVGSSDPGVGVSEGVGETGGGASAVAQIFAASVAVGKRMSHSQLDNDLSYCSIAAQGSEAAIN